MTADIDGAPGAEARLRTALDAAATTEPVPPAWDVIRERVEADERPGPVPAPSARRRSVALAAVVLVVLAVGAAVVVATRPEPATVVTDHTTTAPAPAATGWYVPVDLPGGWVVESVTASRPEGEGCEASAPAPAIDGVTWVDPGRRARLTLVSGACAPPDPSTTTNETSSSDDDDDDDDNMVSTDDVDLGQGVTGEMISDPTAAGPAGFVSWVLEGRAWMLEGVGVTTDELVETARRAVAEGPLAVDPDGFAEADRWSAPPGPQPTVEVVLRAPSGTRLLYRLDAPGRGTGRGSIDPRPYDPAGQDLPVWRLWQGDVWWAMRVVGGWPAADMSVMVLVADAAPLGSAEDQVLDRDVDTLVGHLRPATTEGWRTFLDGVEHTAVLDEAATIADLGDLDVPPPPGPPPEGPPPTTTG